MKDKWLMEMNKTELSWVTWSGLLKDVFDIQRFLLNRGTKLPLSE